MLTDVRRIPVSVWMSVILHIGFDVLGIPSTVTG